MMTVLNFFWHQMCGFFPTPIRYPTIQFYSDTNYPELAQVKGWRLSPTRLPSLQMPAVNVVPSYPHFFQLTTNLEILMTTSSDLLILSNDSQNSGKYYTYHYGFIIKDTTQEQPNEKMHKARYLGCGWHRVSNGFSACTTLTAPHSLGVFMEISLYRHGHWWMSCLSRPSSLPGGQ